MVKVSETFKKNFTYQHIFKHSTSFFLKWFSYFIGSGALAPPKASQALQFLIKQLGEANTHDFLKIKIEGVSEVSKSDAREKIDHFSHKYKVKLEKVAGKETYYIVGFTA